MRKQILTFALFCCTAFSLFAQSSGQKPGDGQFLKEADQIVQMSALPLDQKQKFADAVMKMEDARRSREEGKRPDREQLRQAMKTMRDIAHSDQLKPEEKEKLRASMRKLRGEGGRRGSRARKDA